MLGLALRLGLAAPLPFMVHHQAPAPPPAAIRVELPAVATAPPTATTTTTTTTAPAKCSLTWTLVSPYSFGNADGELAPPGTTGTWSVPCSAVPATEAPFPSDTVFDVEHD